MMKQKKNKNQEMLKGQRGFTLTEMMMVVLLFPILFLTLFSTLTAAQSLFRAQNVQSGLNQGAMQMLRYVAREVGESNPSSSANRVSILHRG